MGGNPAEMSGPSGPSTGGAWLSSARVVRCWVKSRNERNLVRCCQRVMPGTHRRLPGSTRRKVGMTSSHHAPYVQGFTHATMAGTMGCDAVRWSESQKAGLSSDRGLQLDPVKSESLVIADQHCCGEYVPGPCTHRPSRHESRQHPKPMAQPVSGGSGRRWGWRLGRSRNKVAVPEGAAGSPPF